MTYTLSIIIICIVFILILVSLSWLYTHQVSLEPFMSMSFSAITDDISKGNPVSKSNRVNPYLPVDLRLQKPEYVYQGHGIPLIHEDYVTQPVDYSMVAYHTYQCRPECCLYNQESCTNGCVCRNYPPIEAVEQNSAISPRS